MIDKTPAFPTADQRDAAGYLVNEGSDGLSKREWFAGQVAPAIIAATSAGQHMPVMQDGDAHIRDAIARDAVAFADAMLAALRAEQETES